MQFYFYLIAVYAVAIVLGRFKASVPDMAVKGAVILLILTISYWGAEEVYLKTFFVFLVLSFISALLIIMITYSVGFIWNRRFSYRKSRKTDVREFVYLIALILGYFLGYFIRFSIPFDSVLQIELLLLIFLVGIKVGNVLNPNSFLKAWKVAALSIMTALTGGFLASFIIYLMIFRPLSLSFSIAFGFGWYTLDGPLVAKYFGPGAGMAAFLVNFFREQFTFVLVPFLSRLGKNPEGLIAVGGATTMDTTLGLFTEALGADYALVSTINGIVLSVIVPVIVPFIATL
ncbi:MAG: lysine exporter LysO family protein [Nitrososphaeria archaeon]|nr:lysine exporter LysO family protein [Conexivisphaerales archaeon]